MSCISHCINNAGEISSECAPVCGGGGGEAVVLEHVVVGDLHARRDVLPRKDADAHFPCADMNDRPLSDAQFRQVAC